jgi:uncharacterized protein (TIGR02594 family)
MPDQPIPDDPWEAARVADPATQLADPWEAARNADPATQLVAPTAAPVPDAALKNPPRSSIGDGIVATAAKLGGADSSSIRSFFKQTGQSLDPRQSNWCAAYVNGVLSANGVQGVTGPGKNIATSFMKWGAPVQGEPLPGDVMVLPHGRSPGALGGHVGIAMGQVADGKSGTFYLMQSGNESDRVQYTWEPARGVVIRRAPTPQGGGDAR